jgi:hypothetical protein
VLGNHCPDDKIPREWLPLIAAVPRNVYTEPRSDMRVRQVLQTCTPIHTPIKREAVRADECKFEAFSVEPSRAISALKAKLGGDPTSTTID